MSVRSATSTARLTLKSTRRGFPVLVVDDHVVRLRDLGAEAVGWRWPTASASASTSSTTERVASFSRRRRSRRVPSTQRVKRNVVRSSFCLPPRWNFVMFARNSGFTRYGWFGHVEQELVLRRRIDEMRKPRRERISQRSHAVSTCRGRGIHVRFRLPRWDRISQPTARRARHSARIRRTMAVRSLRLRAPAAGGRRRLDVGRNRRRGRGRKSVAIVAGTPGALLAPKRSRPMRASDQTSDAFVADAGSDAHLRSRRSRVEAHLRSSSSRRRRIGRRA